MKKSEMIEAIVNESGVTKSDAERVFTATFNLFKSELKKGEKVAVAGFGTFKVSESANFKSANALKEELN